MTDRPVAIVTGASSGIGTATAVAFARRGYAVVLAARRVERLEEVARQCRAAGPSMAAPAAAMAPAPETQGKPSMAANTAAMAPAAATAPAGIPRGQDARATVLVVPTDVSKEQQVNELVARTVETFGRLDVLVNNAGFGLFERVHETADQDMRAIFDTNFFGVFYGCKAVAPVMIRQRSGHIFNVSSVIGKRGSPFHGAYSATKFALVGLSDSLRVEMMPYNVRVTTICPALTDTEFFRHSRRAQAAGGSFQRFKSLSPPEAVARKIVATVGRNKPELVFTFGGKLLVLINHLWPRLADRMMKLYHDDLAKSL